MKLRELGNATVSEDWSRDGRIVVEMKLWKRGLDDWSGKPEVIELQLTDHEAICFVKQFRKVLAARADRVAVRVNDLKGAVG